MAVVVLVLATTASAAPVRGTVFADRDGDGARDAGEPGVATVVAWDDQVLVRTGDDGSFVLDAPGPGLIWARVPAGYRPGPVWAASDPDHPIDLPLVPLSAAADAAPLSFVVTADTHFAATEHLYDEAELAAMIDQALALDPPPRFFTILGDLTQSTQPDELDAVARVTATRAVPWVPVAGNHDWYDGGVAWRERFGPETYSFDIGDVHLVVIDTNASDEEIAAFLERELGFVDPAATVVVLGHAPLHVEVIDTMERLGVDLFLAGHWHANRVVDHGALLELDTEPFLMGGMDALPAGYRIVTIDAAGIRVEHRHVVRTPWRAGTRCCDPPRPPPASIGAWPQPGGDARHRGAQVDAITPPLAERWATPLGGPITAAPVVGGGRVLVAISDLARGDTGGVVALDAATGAELWRHRTEVPVRASPVLAGELAIVVRTDATALALDAATGAVRWQRALAEGLDPLVTTVMAAPAVDGDTVWVGHQRRFAALDVATGAERWSLDPVPNAKWHTTLAAPAIAADRVVALFERNRAGLRAWTRAGVEVWTVPAASVYSTTATPVIDGDTVYVATGVGDVAAFDLDDGAVRWARVLTDDRHEWAYAIHATPAVAHGTVIVATEHDQLWALDAATGDARWTWTPRQSPLYAAHYRGRGRGFTAAPVITGTIVWAAPTDGTIVALDLATGAERQRLEIGAPVLAGLAAAGDLLIAASLDGTVHAFATAAPARPPGRRVPWALVVLALFGAVAIVALVVRLRATR